MSVESPQSPEGLKPVEWVNEITLIADGGYNIGLERGDRFNVQMDGGWIEMKVTKVTEERSVLERVGSGFTSYGRHSVGELVRRV